ncbi:MAG: GWxTD domain-containing protein [Acidobacteriota bacterium]
MKKILVIVMLLIMAVSVGGKQKYKTKKTPDSLDDFFRKARFIMTRNEKQIYKHLPDKASKEIFIKEFWEKRDPTPDNNENEAKISFEERITFANRWFLEGKGKGSGWNTQRGRIVLQLGIPDRREFGEMDRVNRAGRLETTKRLPMERWFYYRFQLYLVFTDTNGFGNFKLAKIPAALLTAVDLAKITIMDNSKIKTKYRLRFKSSVDKENISIKIPVERISFDEDEANMSASFDIKVYVYKNYIKIDELKTKRNISDTKNNILKKKNIIFKIPVKYKEKGKYYFDIVVKDNMAMSKYRAGDTLKVR